MLDEVVERIVIERNKKVDSLICGETQKIATEYGVTTRITLNEKAIVNALKKQIPRKVTPYCNSGIAVACPECGTFQDFISESTLDNRSPYCYKCGQALDWSTHPTEKGGEG